MKLQAIIPKLPIRDINATKTFYTEKLGFEQTGGSYPDYLMMKRDDVEVHFFIFKELNPRENYGMCYLRVSQIDAMYNEASQKGYQFTGAAKLQVKPWGQKEFSMLDPDNNLLTFGESA